MPLHQPIGKKKKELPAPMSMPNQSNVLGGTPPLPEPTPSPINADLPQNADLVKDAPLQATDSINVDGKTFLVDRATALQVAQNQARVTQENQLISAANPIQLQQRQKNVQQQQPITAQNIQTGIESKASQQIPYMGMNKAALTAETLFKKIQNGQDLTPEDIALISQLQLTDLDIAQIKAGNAHINRLGELVDTVPILGRRKRIAEISIGVTDFITDTPSSRINGLLDSMQQSKSNIISWTNEIKVSPWKAATYLPMIENQETEIQKLQSRIKLLSIQEEKIQAKPEIYNNIQKEIDDILTKTESSKTELQLMGIR